MRSCSLLILAFSALSCAGVEGEGIQTATERAAVVYGSDDRHDVYAEPNAELRALARAAAVALIKPEQLRFSNATNVEVGAAPLGAWDRYCADTPFLEQPTAARCGAVLIDDDLVLTAGHCLDDVAQCSDYFYVFDYLYAAPGELGPLARSELFGCRRVAARETSAPDASEQIDFAVLQLDRLAGPVRAPASIAALVPLVSGEPLRVIGFPSGLPAKLDSGARVGDPRAADLDFFTATSDTFSGSSGSGIYAASGALVGVLARGTADFVDEGQCRSLRRIGDASPSPGEAATYAARAIEALCRDGWPSERLCGIRPSCGDGVCSLGATLPETPETCSRDCSVARCGDGLCEQPEWSRCVEDCGDRRPPGLADEWYCEPAWYADGHTCDCECGARDPDCAGADCDSVGPAGLEPRAVADPPPAPDSGCALSAWSPNPAGVWLLTALLALRRRLIAHQRSPRPRRFRDHRQVVLT